jgi:hypothetical protein
MDVPSARKLTLLDTMILAAATAAGLALLRMFLAGWWRSEPSWIVRSG